MGLESNRRREEILVYIFVCSALINFLFSIVITIPVDTWRTVAKISTVANFVFLFISLGFMGFLLRAKYNDYVNVGGGVAAESLEIVPEEEE